MKKIFIFLLLVALGAGIFFGVKFWLNQQKQKTSGGATNTSSAETLLAEKNSQELVDKIKATVISDADLDGLSNEEEKKFGTNPNLADTDKDGLLDKIELELYKTNPLKADTDGDKFNDGYEVRRGYNPNGPGKLTK